jgi:hypothetical protein
MTLSCPVRTVSAGPWTHRTNDYLGIENGVSTGRADQTSNILAETTENGGWSRDTKLSLNRPQPAIDEIAAMPSSSQAR